MWDENIGFEVKGSPGAPEASWSISVKENIYFLSKEDKWGENIGFEATRSTGAPEAFWSTSVKGSAYFVNKEDVGMRI